MGVSSLPTVCREYNICLHQTSGLTCTLKQHAQARPDEQLRIRALLLPPRLRWCEHQVQALAGRSSGSARRARHPAARSDVGRAGLSEGSRAAEGSSQQLGAAPRAQPCRSSWGPDSRRLPKAEQWEGTVVLSGSMNASQRPQLYSIILTHSPHRTPLRKRPLLENHGKELTISDW